MDDAKEIWEAIRTRFGGNANSKKMQKAVLKHKFEAFTVSSFEGLEKGYDRFQHLLSQLEAHGSGVPADDANHKFFRALPNEWSTVAITMRMKEDVDTWSIDDPYNNLKVFEQDIKGASMASISAANVAFMGQSKSSTGKLNSGCYGTSSSNQRDREVHAGFADEIMYLVFSKGSKDTDLINKDLEEINDDDIEEMDINWQLAMIALRMKRLYKRTRRNLRFDGKTPVGFDKTNPKCYKCNNTCHFTRECPAKVTPDEKKMRDSIYQSQEEMHKKEKNQVGLLTMDDGVVN